MKVRQAMNTQIYSVSRSTTIINIAKAMRRYKTDVVAVRQNGKFRGLVTERDIDFYIAAYGPNLSKETVDRLITNRKPLVSPGLETTEAARIMFRNKVSVLPVTQNGRLLGLLTRDDLVKDSMGMATFMLSKAKDNMCNDYKAHNGRATCIP